MYKDTAIFHMNGHTARHNGSIKGHKRSHEIYDHGREAQNDNVWRNMMHGPVKEFFNTNTISAHIYMDIHRLIVLSKNG
jgi:hypothetical protein